MRDYLNFKERENYILTSKLSDCIRDMAESPFTTKEEKKNLKTASTLLFKSLNSIIDRLSPQAKRTLANALGASGVILTNEFGIQQYTKKKLADEKAAFEENKDYYELAEEVMYQNCNGCSKKGEECRYHYLWDTLYISDMGDDFGNCRFAYDMPLQKEEKIEK